MSYKEFKQASDTLIGWANTVGSIWLKMCEHDGIDPTATFVVFSDDNPYKVFYNSALRQYQETLAVVSQGPGGGYVGLKIGHA